METKRKERKRSRKRITEVTSKAEKDLITLEEEKAALVKAGEYDADAKKRIESKKEELKTELAIYKSDQKETDQEFEQDLLTFQSFLELTTNAHKYWAVANHEQKHKIAEILILNLAFKDKEMQSITAKEPFNTWLTGKKFQNGRHTRT